jgi:hypothetical protein
MTVSAEAAIGEGTGGTRPVRDNSVCVRVTQAAHSARWAARRTYASFLCE